MPSPSVVLKGGRLLLGHHRGRACGVGRQASRVHAKGVGVGSALLMPTPCVCTHAQPARARAHTCACTHEPTEHTHKARLDLPMAPSLTHVSWTLSHVVLYCRHPGAWLASNPHSRAARPPQRHPAAWRLHAGRWVRAGAGGRAGAQAGRRVDAAPAPAAPACCVVGRQAGRRAGAVPVPAPACIGAGWSRGQDQGTVVVAGRGQGPRGRDRAVQGGGGRPGCAPAGPCMAAPLRAMPCHAAGRRRVHWCSSSSSDGPSRRPTPCPPACRVAAPGRPGRWPRPWAAPPPGPGASGWRRTCPPSRRAWQWMQRSWACSKVRGGWRGGAGGGGGGRGQVKVWSRGSEVEVTT